MSAGIYLIESKLRDGDETGSVFEAIADTKSAADVAIELLSDFLNYEKLNSNQLTLDLGPVNLSTLIEEKLRPMQLLATKKNVTLTFCCDDVVNDGITHVDADASKIAIVLRNFVSNAIKFSPEGGSVYVTKRIIHDEIETRVEGEASSFLFDPSAFRWLQSSVSPEPSKQFMVRVTVQDMGYCISLENQQKVFNGIVQFHTNAHQQGGGSGMGLWISKRIIDLHRGKVGVMSGGEGHGSTFYFDIPVSKIECQTSPPPLQRRENPRNPFTLIHKRTSESQERRPFFRNFTILVADDSSLNRKMIRRMFESLGHRCLEADDGDTAIELVEKSIRDELFFDAIIIDNFMQRLNGPDAIKVIRRLGYKNLVFGLTGSVAAEDIQTFLSAGVDKVLIKPVSLTDLGELVSWINDWYMMLNGDA